MTEIIAQHSEEAHENIIQSVPEISSDKVESNQIGTKNTTDETTQPESKGLDLITHAARLGIQRTAISLPAAPSIRYGRSHGDNITFYQ